LNLAGLRFQRSLAVRSDIKRAAEGELSLRRSEETVSDMAIQYLLIRARQHAAVMRAQENPVIHTVVK